MMHAHAANRCESIQRQKWPPCARRGRQEWEEKARTICIGRHGNYLLRLCHQDSPDDTTNLSVLCCRQAHDGQRHSRRHIDRLRATKLRLLRRAVLRADPPYPALPFVNAGPLAIRRAFCRLVLECKQIHTPYAPNWSSDARRSDVARQDSVDCAPHGTRVGRGPLALPGTGGGSWTAGRFGWRHSLENS